MKKLPNKKIYIGDIPDNSQNEKSQHADSPPPLKDQLINFARSFAGWIKEGAPVVTPKEYMDRLTRCHVCPSYNKNKDRCNECGCTMVMKAKMKTSSCPLNKWYEIPEDGKK